MEGDTDGRDGKCRGSGPGKGAVAVDIERLPCIWYRRALSFLLILRPILGDQYAKGRRMLAFVHE